MKARNILIFVTLPLNIVCRAIQMEACFVDDMRSVKIYIAYGPHNFLRLPTELRWMILKYLAEFVGELSLKGSKIPVHVCILRQIRLKTISHSEPIDM